MHLIGRVFRAAPELLAALEDLFEAAEFAHAEDPKNPTYAGWEEILEQAKEALELAGHPVPLDTSDPAWRDKRED